MVMKEPLSVLSEMGLQSPMISSSDIKHLMDEKSLNDRSMDEFAEKFRCSNDVSFYTQPTSRVLINCPKPVCVPTTFIGYATACLNNTECQHELQKVENNSADFRVKKTMYSRTFPKSIQKFEVQCSNATVIQQSDEDNSKYMFPCSDMISVKINNATTNRSFIEVGSGRDFIYGFEEYDNVMTIGAGEKRIVGGRKADLFILQGNDSITGFINGFEGPDELNLFSYNIKGTLKIEHIKNPSRLILTNDCSGCSKNRLELLGMKSSTIDLTDLSLKHKNSSTALTLKLVFEYSGTNFPSKNQEVLFGMITLTHFPANVINELITIKTDNSVLMIDTEKRTLKPKPVYYSNQTEIIILTVDDDIDHLIIDHEIDRTTFVKCNESLSINSNIVKPDHNEVHIPNDQGITVTLLGYFDATKDQRKKFDGLRFDFINRSLVLSDELETKQFKIRIGCGSGNVGSKRPVFPNEISCPCALILRFYDPHCALMSCSLLSGALMSAHANCQYLKILGIFFHLEKFTVVNKS
uniref:Uncharacterized protein n=1 Tax=Romanomermis culicivorax TaxID=13658 RepID=A0A915III1_ROMCU